MKMPVQSGQNGQIGHHAPELVGEASKVNSGNVPWQEMEGHHYFVKEKLFLTLSVILKIAHLGEVGGNGQVAPNPVEGVLEQKLENVCCLVELRIHPHVWGLRKILKFATLKHALIGLTGLNGLLVQHLVVGEYERGEGIV